MANAATKPLNRQMIEWFLNKLLASPTGEQDEQAAAAITSIS